MMPVVPGGLDQYPPQMRIAGFGDVAAGLFRAAGVFGRDEAGKGHHARGGWKAAGVAEFGRDGERGEIVDAAEAAQALDAGAQRFEREEVAEFGVDGVEPADSFVDRADVGAVGLLERGQRPALGL